MKVPSVRRYTLEVGMGTENRPIFRWRMQKIIISVQLSVYAEIGFIWMARTMPAEFVAVRYSVVV